jgi:tRNA threonylcarbamoyladenosine biosynthesis protein TsaB
MKLIIDTTKNRETMVKIIDLKPEIEVIAVSGHKSQSTLPAIEKILTQNNLTLESMTDFEVNAGPGSFTGVRVGIAVARTIAWLFARRINHQNPQVNIVPIYTQSRFD